MSDIKVVHGDMLEVLPTLEENSIDSVVCDPPYHLTSIVKRFGSENSAPAKYGTDGAFARASKGFMGKQWDGGDIAFRPETWAEVYRVMKPGAHLIAFSGTRTYHKMACAIEDAGFEIRDQLGWLYGSGFPKSHDISKAIDKMAGVEREKVRTPMGPTGNKYARGLGDSRPWMEKAAELGFHEHDSNISVTDAAKQWDGWGTALKPAWEPIVLARKPLSEFNIAKNVLKHSTGAINVDESRIPTDELKSGDYCRKHVDSIYNEGTSGLTRSFTYDGTKGRWPANLVHDGSPEVLEEFARYGTSDSGHDTGKRGTGGICNKSRGIPCGPQHGDSGTPARYFASLGYSEEDDSFWNSEEARRFFYTAKAPADERMGVNHPTVKPIALMKWLCKLVTPPGGIVLDPFAGSGTTGIAAKICGFNAILIEMEAEHIEMIHTRLNYKGKKSSPKRVVVREEKSGGLW